MTKEEKEKIILDNYRLIYSVVIKFKNCYGCYDVEDYVQDCIVKVYELLDKYDDSKSKISTYIYMICKFVMIKKYHKMKRINYNIVHIDYDIENERNDIEDKLSDIYIDEVLKDNFSGKNYQIMYDVYIKEIYPGEIFDKYGFNSKRSLQSYISSLNNKLKDKKIL